MIYMIFQPVFFEGRRGFQKIRVSSIPVNEYSSFFERY